MRPVPHRPLLTPSAQVALMVLVVVTVLGLAALSGPAQLAVGLAVAGVVLAWGWSGLLALPSPRGSAAVLVVAALGLVAAVLPIGSGARLDRLAPVLGLVVVVALLHQVLRRDGRPRLVESVTSVVLGVLVIAAGALLVPATDHDEGRLLVVAALLGSAGAALADVGGRWGRVRPWVVPAALLAGAVLALLVAVVGDTEAHWTVYLLLGVASAAVGHAVRAVLSVLPTMAHARPRLVAAVASVLVTGGVLYAVTLALAPDVLLS